MDRNLSCEDDAVLVLKFLNGEWMKGERGKHLQEGRKTNFYEDFSEFNTCTGRWNRFHPTIPRTYKARFRNVLFIFSLLTFIFTHSRSPKLPQYLKLPLTWKQHQLNNHRVVEGKRGCRKRSWWVSFVTTPHLQIFSVDKINRKNPRKT